MVGKLAGDYRLLARIGQGGMAVIYRAQGPASETQFAVKILSPLAAETGQLARRFQREAAILKRLRHPHIVPVIDFGEVDGRPFLVMPLVEGGSMAVRLDRGPLSPQDGGRILGQIASGLSYAHGEGVIHRDIKPSNVLLDAQGNAQLSDFGLAQVHDASVSLTGSALIGTPSYVSPEQARGAPVDARADQYSLGIVLYEMTTGRLPFVADTPMAVVVMHMREPLPRPRSVNPNVPLAVERVILKATAKDPQDRFPSVHAMNDAFQEALAHTLRPTGAAPALVQVPPSAQTTLPLDGAAAEPPDRRRRRRLGLAGGLALLALLCALAGAGAVLPLGRPAAQPSPGPSFAQSADPQLSLLGTIEVLSIRLAMQEAEGPEDVRLLAELQATLVALPTRSMGSEGLSSAAPDGLGSPIALTGTAPVVGGSSTPAQSFPTSTGVGPTPTPTRTLLAGATQTPTPVPTALGGGNPSATSPPALPGSSPTWTASPLPPSSTRTPTSTLVPPTATSAPPASTHTPNICSLIDYQLAGRNGQEYNIRIKNNTGQQIQISSVYLDWPVSNAKLKKVELGGSEIWNGEDSSPPTSFACSGSACRINAGSDKVMVSFYDQSAASSGYTLSMSYTNGCEVEEDF